MCLIVNPWLCPMIKYCTHYCKLFQAATQCSNPRTFAQSRSMDLHMRRLPIKKKYISQKSRRQWRSIIERSSRTSKPYRARVHAWERCVFVYAVCVCTRSLIFYLICILFFFCNYFSLRLMRVRFCGTLESAWRGFFHSGNKTAPSLRLRAWAKVWVLPLGDKEMTSYTKTAVWKSAWWAHFKVLSRNRKHCQTSCSKCKTGAQYSLSLAVYIL